MKHVIAIIVFVMTGTICTGQKVDWKKLDALEADRVLMAGAPKPTKVLMLGTFHFAYQNLDRHKTDSVNFIDVLSPVRQKELEQLAEVIARFNPTRVYIESTNQLRHDSLFTEYLNGKFKPTANEIFQVGYRVAKNGGHRKVYAVDASNFVSENYTRYPWLDSMWKLNDGVDTVRDKIWNDQYTKYYDAGDSVEKHLTMLENFLLMAKPSTLRRMHGAYMTGGFNTKGSSGPDLMSMWWYNRNLRIFNNILGTRPGSEDRILVLFGNGHAPILKHCFETSPEFELVELKSLVNK